MEAQIQPGPVGRFLDQDGIVRLIGSMQTAGELPSSLHSGVRTSRSPLLNRKRDLELSSRSFPSKLSIRLLAEEGVDRLRTRIKKEHSLWNPGERSAKLQREAGRLVRSCLSRLGSDAPELVSIAVDMQSRFYRHNGRIICHLRVFAADTRRRLIRLEVGHLYDLKKELERVAAVHSAASAVRRQLRLDGKLIEFEGPAWSAAQIRGLSPDLIFDGLRRTGKLGFRLPTGALSGRFTWEDFRVSVRIDATASFGGTLMLEGNKLFLSDPLPETLLPSLVGRPILKVVEASFLPSDATIVQAENTLKGGIRLTFDAQPRSLAPRETSS